MKSKYAEFLEMIRQDLSNFAFATYRDYGIVIECIFALFLGYLFFKLGRALNVDSTLKKIEMLNSYDQSKSRLSEKEIKIKVTVQRLKTLLKFVAVLMLLLNIALYTSIQQINNTLMSYKLTPLTQLSEKVAITCLCALLFIFSWILLGRYEKYVASKTKNQINNLDSIESKEISSLMQIIGTEALRKIKNRLCKDLIIKLARENDRYTCRKDKCILERKLLGDSFDIHTKFVKRALEFKWCDICVSRKKGEKYEPKPYVETGKVYDSEQSEVQDRLNMLYVETVKIVNFIDQLCKSQCNIRYWKLSKEIGQIYKLERGENLKKQQELERLKDKQPYREANALHERKSLTSIGTLPQPSNGDESPTKK